MELEQVADVAQSHFQKIVTEIVLAAGLNPDEKVMCKGKPLWLDEDKGVQFQRLTLATLKTKGDKGRARCGEKVANEYNGEYFQLVDAVRCSIVVDTEEQLMTVALERRQQIKARLPI